LGASGPAPTLIDLRAPRSSCGRTLRRLCCAYCSPPSGLTAALAGKLFMAERSTRVAVFIDWQNVYKAAREAFGLGQLPNERGNFSPFKLARVLAAGHGRGSAGELLRVEVHRGLPSSSRDPVGYGANRRQATAWVKEGGSIVVPRLRPLRYPSPHAKDRAPVEKGIDVQLALAVAEAILTDAADVAVLFTHDTDLLPAVEMVARLKGPRRIETASWSSGKFAQRLREMPGVHHHRISGKVAGRGVRLLLFRGTAPSSGKGARRWRHGSRPAVPRRVRQGQLRIVDRTLSRRLVSRPRSPHCLPSPSVVRLKPLDRCVHAGRHVLLGTNVIGDSALELGLGVKKTPPPNTGRKEERGKTSTKKIARRSSPSSGRG
jgi:hypothetical protein